MTLTPSQIAEYAYDAGFRGADLVTAVAVALAESGGRTDALNNRGEDSRGLWQINVGPGAHTQWAGLNLYDPAENARAAYSLYSSNGGFRDWTTYTGGAFRGFVAQATAGASSLVNAVGARPSGGGVGVSPNGVQTPIGTIGVPQLTIPPITVPGSSDLANAANGVIQSVQQVTAPVTAGIANLGQIVNLIGDPKIYVSLALIGVGFALTLVGLAFLGLSFVPKGTPLPVPV